MGRPDGAKPGHRAERPDRLAVVQMYPACWQCNTRCRASRAAPRLRNPQRRIVTRRPAPAGRSTANAHRPCLRCARLGQRAPQLRARRVPAGTASVDPPAVRVPGRSDHLPRLDCRCRRARARAFDQRDITMRDATTLRPQRLSPLVSDGALVATSTALARWRVRCRRVMVVPLCYGCYGGGGNGADDSTSRVAQQQWSCAA